MANCFYVMTRKGICESLPSLAVAGKPGKRHARRAHKPQADSDWLNPNGIRLHREFNLKFNLFK